MPDNNTPDNGPSNPFQLNLNEIKPVGQTPAPQPEPPAPQPIEPEPPVQEPEPQPEVATLQPPVEVQQSVEPAQPIEPQPVAQPVVQPAPQQPVAQSQSETQQSAVMIRDDDRMTRIMTLLATVVALVVILGVSYWSTFIDLVKTWESNIDYHHGFFVIPFTIYFLWARRHDYPMRQSQRDVSIGVVLGAILLLIWGYCRFSSMAYATVSLDSWTILLWVLAVCLLCFGFRVFRWAFPSLMFLAFMFPWPYRLENQLRGPLQELAAKLSAYILQLCGEPAIAQANIVLMSDNQQLDVAAACSGIRVLVSIIAAAYAAMLLMRRPWWQNLLLFCLVIPVALMVNAIRIAMTGLLIKHASGMVAGFGFKKPVPVVCDEISGIVMLILTFVFFVLIIWWFSKVFQRVEVSDQQMRIRQE